MMNSANVVVVSTATVSAPTNTTTTSGPSAVVKNNATYVSSNTSVSRVDQHNSNQTVNVTPTPPTNASSPQNTTTTTITSTTTTTAPASNNKNQNHSTAIQPSNGSISDSLASAEGHRTPNVDSLSKTNLYIRGLQTNTSDQDLYNMCARFGQISSTKAILDKATGCCRGYGFVEFTSPKSAELAVQELTKSGIQAQMAKITPPYSSNQQYHQHHHHNNNNNNSNSSSNNNNHHQHHHHHHHNHHNNSNNNGHHQNHHHHNQQHHHPQHHNSNNNKGNNSFNSSSSNNTNNHNNSSGQQHYSNSSTMNTADPTNLYIANLPSNLSEQELENLLSNYGPVVSTRILRDQDNIPRGVGFARMESRDKCEQIIEQLNGRPYKGWPLPLVVKFADGGTKKRNNHNNHHHQHQSNNHQHQHHKNHQDDTSRWQEGGNSSDLSSVTNFDQPSNIPHSNHLPDLAMMSPISYPRIQPGFSPTVAAGSAYQPHLVPPTSAPQWIHTGAPGQPYVLPPQMMQATGLGPSNQAAAAAAAALHYGHISQMTSQMQGLQIAHPGAPVAGYLPHQHQWSALWTHQMPPQPQQSMRLATTMPTHSSPQPKQQQVPHQPPPPPLSGQQQSVVGENKTQAPIP